MSFAWPYALVLLIAGPLVLGAYRLWLRRRRRFAVNFASLSLIREALPARAHWRRRVPFALFLLALATLAIAAARPQARIVVPVSRTSVILAIDVSRSMCATDVEPNRLTVAQEVARTFIDDQPGDTRIGIVAFSGLAQLVVPPTTDREALTKAIDGFTAGRGTAVGTALLRAIDAIAEINPDVPRSGINLDGVPGRPAASEPGYEPDIVVLLTDGATTQGINPLAASRQAAERRVRVYTIGFGTERAAPLVCTREQLGTDVFGPQFGGGQFGGGGFGGGAGTPRRAVLARDEITLQQMADITGGAYRRAEDAEQLAQVFRDLPKEVAFQRENVEVSVVFAALGALLATAAVALSLAWNRAG